MLLATMLSKETSSASYCLSCRLSPLLSLLTPWMPSLLITSHTTAGGIDYDYVRTFWLGKGDESSSNESEKKPSENSDRRTEAYFFNLILVDRDRFNFLSGSIVM